MTDPLWRGPVELTWDGERLMAGRIVVGQVHPYSGNRSHWAIRDVLGNWSMPVPHAEARSACLDAAVRALSGEAT